MKPFTIVFAGLLWTAVAVLITRFYTNNWTQVMEVTWRYVPASVVTSFVVTWVFKRVLASPDIGKKYTLPFLTIPVGVSVWSTVLFLCAAVVSVVHGRKDIFDGYFVFLFMGVGISLSVALPLTYPVALLTQKMIGRSCLSKT